MENLNKNINIGLENITKNIQRIQDTAKPLIEFKESMDALTKKINGMQANVIKASESCNNAIKGMEEAVFKVNATLKVPQDVLDKINSIGKMFENLPSESIKDSTE